MNVRQATRQLADEAWVDRAARIGLAVRGVVFVILAYLVGRIASGALGGDTTSKPASGPGVAQSIAAQSGGRVVLFVLACGLVFYALFSLLDAVIHHNAESSLAKRWGARLVAAWGFAVYGAFSIFCFVTATSDESTGTSSRAEDAQQAQWSARVLRWPGGWFLLGALAFALLVAACVLAIAGIRRSFRDNLDESAMSPGIDRAATVLGTVGCVGRAGMFALVGYFVARAAIEDDPSNGQGVDGSARQLA
ncbi:MAG: hypothetical protein QOH89_1714, partial [Pseudonocardiales bacterium]|nr:hypothetical protein [Pseudonocardiales bacterium]